jgi:hypothetical protein
MRASGDRQPPSNRHRVRMPARFREETMRRFEQFSVLATVLLVAAMATAEGTVDDPNALAVEATSEQANVDSALQAETSQEVSEETAAWLEESAEGPAEAAVATANDETTEAVGPAALPGTQEDALPLDGSESAAADSVGADPVGEAISVVSLPAEPDPVIPGVVLGPVGIDDLGRTGRLHTVARGDTLWDLAAAYLGTPWVWPSVWIDNDDIANPHRIEPGDLIWITANEMRVVSDAEAQSFIEAVPATAAVESPSEAVGDDLEEAPAAPVAALEETAGEDEAATLEAFPVAVPGESARSFDATRQVTVSRREAMGFVSVDELAGASTIVDSPVERTYLAEGDRVYLGLGEGDVEVGDQFSIFQVIEDVRDPETNRLVGHHVDPLGWIEVRELTGDTSIGEIRTSYAEIERGAHISRRPEVSAKVTLQSTPDVIEGSVIFLPAERTIMADGGYVYLNRGEFHGVEVGSELEVFEAGEVMQDASRRVDVRTPDHVVATLVVVTVQPDSAVAFVLSADRELAVGDRVRATMPKLAQR